MVSIPVNGKSKFMQLQRTKLYDVGIALPFLAVIFYRLPDRWPSILAGLRALAAGHISYMQIMNWVWQLSSLVFSLLLIFLFLTRKLPERKSEGILPRVVAICGTFSVAGFRLLDPAHLSFTAQVIGTLLSVIGTIGSVIAVQRLGRSFSLLPEARGLVTTGAYSIVRHPLYLAEIVAVWGLMIRYEQPWSFVIGATVMGMLYWRTLFEEEVLTAAYPEYSSYAKRTPRLIPYVF